MNVLVTGAAGYIGSLLSKKILEAGHNLFFFDLKHLDVPEINLITNHNRCKTYYGDLRDTNLIKEAVKDCDVVIHLAGISDGRMGMKDPEFTKKINIDATKHLIDKAKNEGVKRFLYASTFGVYGNKYSGALTEDLRLDPVDPYSESKAKCEEILSMANDNNFVTCSLRIAMVFGLSILTRFDFLVNQLVKIAIDSGKINIIGGSQRRPQVHVQDVTDYYLNLITTEPSFISGKCFNVVSSNPSLNEITQTIQKFLPKTNISLSPGREDEDSFELNATKIKNELNFIPRCDIENGIQELIGSIILNEKKNKLWNGSEKD